MTRWCAPVAKDVLSVKTGAGKREFEWTGGTFLLLRAFFVFKN